MNSDTILERLMTLHPKIIDLTLDRMTRLLDLLGSPEKALPPVIHIAGTNGKGFNTSNDTGRTRGIWRYMSCIYISSFS